MYVLISLNIQQHTVHKVFYTMRLHVSVPLKEIKLSNSYMYVFFNVLNKLCLTA